MKNPAKYACNYAVLRFLPYPEMEEFVNMGIVLHCPERGFFDVRIEDRRTKRVTNFFPELHPKIFREARRGIVKEIERVKELVAHEKNVDLGRRIFRDLVRHREAVFRFGETRTILANDPNTIAKDLFEQYVNRHFARHKEYQETVMAARFYKALQDFCPDRVFHRNQKVGTEKYHVVIPICSGQQMDGVPLRAIKPLDLARDEPTAIIEHGDAWIQRVRRLRDIHQLPKRFIFAIRHPNNSDCEEAASQVLADLKREKGVLLVAEDEKEKILELAVD